MLSLLGVLPAARDKKGLYGADVADVMPDERTDLGDPGALRVEPGTLALVDDGQLMDADAEYAPVYVASPPANIGSAADASLDIMSNRVSIGTIQIGFSAPTPPDSILIGTSPATPPAVRPSFGGATSAADDDDGRLMDADAEDAPVYVARPPANVDSAAAASLVDTVSYCDCGPIPAVRPSFGGAASATSAADDDDGTCAICMDAPINAACVPCGHGGCEACLRAVHAVGGECATCRGEVTLVLKLFL